MYKKEGLTYMEKKRFQRNRHAKQHSFFCFTPPISLVTFPLLPDPFRATGFAIKYAKYVWFRKLQTHPKPIPPVPSETSGFHCQLGSLTILSIQRLKTYLEQLLCCW